jgi:hypothetical protein
MACFFDRNPRSVALNAKPQGRVEVVSIFFKLVLSFTFLISNLPANLLVFVVCIASSSLLYCYYTYLPFFNQRMNQLYVAFCCVYTWASFCALVAQYRQQENVRRV